MAEITVEEAKKTAFPSTWEGLITFYNTIYFDRGIFLPPHLYDVARALMDERIRKLMILIGPGGGKSMLLSVCYPAFRLGNDPTTTILGISAGEALMQGFQKAVMEFVKNSEIWKLAFPSVRPDEEAGWSTERGMYVTGRNPGDPDASYFAAGLTSSALTGKHARQLIIDDIHNAENAASAEACGKVIAKYYDTIIGRADPRGARFIMAGRRWSQDDIYAHLMAEQAHEWVIMSLPAEREGSGQLYWDIQMPDGFVCCFNDGVTG